MTVPPQLKAWNAHLKKVRAMHPHMEYKKVVQLAKKSYRSKASASKPKPIKYYANGEPYNYGRAWTTDRFQFSKSEDWEVPISKRKIPVRSRRR